MTNKDYFIQMLGYAPGVNVAEAALIDAGINGVDQYVSVNRAIMLPFVLQTLYLLLSTPDITQGTGETTFKVAHDRDAIWRRIGVLETEQGLSGKPTITSRQVW